MKTFNTRKEALSALSEYDKGTYYLSHGEYSRPCYTVRKIANEDKYYIYAKRYYYVGTFNTKKSGALTEDDMYNPY